MREGSSGIVAESKAREIDGGIDPNNLRMRREERENEHRR
jgi:hypothetical protein